VVSSTYMFQSNYGTTIKSQFRRLYLVVWDWAQVIRCLNRRIMSMRVGVPMIFGIGVGNPDVIPSFSAMVECVLTMMLTRASVEGRSCV
jgi:hypothetical protein